MLNSILSSTKLNTTYFLRKSYIICSIFIAFKFHFKISIGNERNDRSIIELFVKDIKIFPDNVIVTLRKLPNLHKSGDPDLDPFLCDKLTITVNIDNNYMKISQE